MQIRNFFGICFFCVWSDLYVSTGEVLGEGSFGQVKTYRNISNGKEFAVKVVLFSIKSLKQNFYVYYPVQLLLH